MQHHGRVRLFGSAREHLEAAAGIAFMIEHVRRVAKTIRVRFLPRDFLSVEAGERSGNLDLGLLLALARIGRKLVVSRPWGCLFARAAWTRKILTGSRL